MVSFQKVLRDLDLHFECQQFFNLYFSERERASENVWETLIDFDICHFEKIVLRDLSLLCEDKKTVRASAKICGKHLQISTYPIKCCQFENYIPWHWLTFLYLYNFFLIYNFLFYISETVRAIAKMCERQTFVDFDICHQMVSFRKLYTAILTYILKVNCF